MQTSIDKRRSLIGSWIAAAGDWLRRYRLKRQSQRFFDTCDQQEVMLIATDIGISPRDLRRLVKHGPDAAKLLLRRMAALHLDPEVVSATEPGVMRDLQRLCSTCASQRRCKRDLDRDPDNSVWQHYCPNEPTLDALQQAPSPRH
jgi:hypothetical protein